MKSGIPTTGIFVSYHHDDVALAGALASGLAAHGFDVVWDKLIEPGERWEGWLKHEIRRAKVVIICATLKSIKSDSVKYEIQLTKECGKRALFVVFDGINTAQLPWGTLEEQMLELTGVQDEIHRHPNWPRLVASMENRLRPLWITQRIAGLEEALEMETKRRKAAEDSNAARELLSAQDAAERSALIQTRDKAVAEKIILSANLDAASRDRDAAKRDMAENAEIEHKHNALADAHNRLVADHGRLTVNLEAHQTAKQVLEGELQKLKDQMALVDPNILAALADRTTSGPAPPGQRRVAGEFGGLRYTQAPPPLSGMRMIRVELGTVEIKCYPKVRPGMSSTPIALQNRIERPFEVGESLVTNRDWAALMNLQAAGGVPNEPATNVTFDEATLFLERLNQKAGGGFYMLSEQDWLFAIIRINERHNSAYPGEGAGGHHLEWIFTEWRDYADIVDGPNSPEMSAGRGRMTRHDLLDPDAPGLMFQRQFWPSAMRSDQIGFRIARRL